LWVGPEKCFQFGNAKKNMLAVIPALCLKPDVVRRLAVHFPN